jgi:hypothetical protein
VAADERRFNADKTSAFDRRFNRCSSVALILELLIDNEEYGQAGGLVLVGYDGGAGTRHKRQITSRFFLRSRFRVQTGLLAAGIIDFNAEARRR